MREARPLTLDRAAVIVCAEDMVHVVQRRTALDLRGRHVDKVHGRIAPMLDGRFTREQLLAAAGSRREAVARYLDGLSRSGALHEGAAPPGLPAGFPQPTPGVQTLNAHGRRISVVLSGAEPADSRAFSVSFPTRSELDRRLFDLDKRRVSAGGMWIVVPQQEADAAELERRAAVCRHLLAIELGRAEGGRLSVFELAGDRLALKRIAVLEPQQPLAVLPVEMRLVRHVDRPQLPLCSMVAELRGLDRRRIGYGIDAKEVRQALTMDFFCREALQNAVAAGTARAGRGYVDDQPARDRPAAVTAQLAAQACFGSSPTRCAERALCAWAGTVASAEGRPIDLLEIEPPSRRVAVLQDILRRRGASVTGLLDHRFAPLLSFRLAFTIARLDFEELVAEALLRTAGAELGLSGAGALPCLPSVAHPATLRRRLRAALARMPTRLSMIRGAVRWLGTTAFFGTITDVTDD